MLEEDNCVSSNEGNQSAFLEVEATLFLDLLNTVVGDAKNIEEGRFIVCMDCRKVWELLIADTLKVIQHAGDGKAIIGKTLELE